MDSLQTLIEELRADADLQRDLRNPEVFVVFVAESHEVPDQFHSTFAKLGKLQQACKKAGEEFSVDLIVPPLASHSLENATVLDFTPMQAVRQRRETEKLLKEVDNDSSDEGEEDRYSKIIRPPICSWEVIIATLCSMLLILYFTASSPPPLPIHNKVDSSVAFMPLPPSSKVLQDFNVDICRFPSNIRKHSSKQEITIGDLHGNAMKLVYFLVHEGVMVNLPSGDFSRLCTIYHTSPSTNAKEFSSIIFRTRIATQHPKIRLLGDEFADRGANDELTLIVLEKLAEEADLQRIEILLSNHGFEFYSYNQDDHMNRLSFKFLSGLQEHAAFSRSLHVFHNTVRDKSRATRVLKTIYKHFLKLISYSVTNNSNDILIFTHAPIGLEVLVQFANDFVLPQDMCGNVQAMEANLLHCIDLVQQRFDLEIKQKISNGMRRSRSIQQLLWRRASDGKVTRPLLTHDGKQVRWVHGHDGFEVSAKPYGYCMDDEFGKEWNDPNPQIYSVMVTN